MRILLLYDNFIRDYRGLLLLKEYLKNMGHRVWIKATWNDPTTFCADFNIQAVVTGQIAEWSTHFVGKYCFKHKILLIINSSEPVTSEKNFELLITYNTSELNESIIDMQTVGTFPHIKFIKAHEVVNEKNKQKYKFIGYPRTDISFSEELRKVESQHFTDKYNLKKYKKKYLFLSSFLLDGAFNGIPQQDLDRWNFSDFQDRTIHLLAHVSKILKKFIDENLGEDDVMIIKKHPWDCSSFFNESFSSKKCIILNNNDFITSCMDVADVILHTYSTAAFEAWMMNKLTVSIYKEEYWDIVPIHMNKENVAFDFESLDEIINKSKVVDSYNDEFLFNGSIDGKATLRLAKEISLLTPKKKVRMPLSYQGIKKRWNNIKKYNDLNTGKFKYDVEALAEKNTKHFDFLTWENERAFVNKMYEKPIKKFAKKIMRSKR